MAAKKPYQLKMEYYAVLCAFTLCRILPLGVLEILSDFLGALLWTFIPRRRRIAVENVRHALNGRHEDLGEARAIARQSCKAFFMIPFEAVKVRSMLARPDRMEHLRERIRGVDELFRKARAIHDESGGCIFVTPHIGNWEILPYASSVVGIPLAVVARPLDNPLLEKLLYANRVGSGQMVVPKKNALFKLKKLLQRRMSIGVLPDQATAKGLPVNFFGRKALATPVPALLAVVHRRPIVVVACCRKWDNFHYEGFVSDPIYPAAHDDEKQELIRLTEAMNREMERIILRYPEQYLWMHNRWKTY